MGGGNFIHFFYSIDLFIGIWLEAGYYVSS